MTLRNDQLCVADNTIETVDLGIQRTRHCDGDLLFDFHSRTATVSEMTLFFMKITPLRSLECFRPLSTRRLSLLVIFPDISDANELALDDELLRN